MTHAPLAQSSGGLPAHRPAPSRQQAAASLLKRIRDNHLSVRRDWEAMYSDHEARRKIGLANHPFLWPSSIRVRQPSTEEDREKSIGYLIDQGAEQADPVEVRALAKRLEEAIDKGFNAPEARIAIGLMIDAYPNARPHSPEAYVASVIDILEGEDLPTLAISLACHDLKTSSTFLPSLAEVVEKMKAAAKSLDLMRNRMARYLDWADRSDEAIKWLRAVDLQPDSKEEREAFPGNDPW